MPWPIKPKAQGWRKSGLCPTAQHHFRTGWRQTRAKDRGARDKIQNRAGDEGHVQQGSDQHYCTCKCVSGDAASQVSVKGNRTGEVFGT
eukprot:scaffold123563_cov20-Tisochrysis_lutea.AAC.4